MNRRGWSVLFICTALLAGCSAENLKARFALYQAEQLFWKTHVQMKSRKVSFENRQPFYKKSCDLYLQAFQRAPELFHSARIEEASLVCSNAGSSEAEDLFGSYYELYCKDHPKECEYGDIPAASFAEY